jgi:hypothetical protein
MATTTELHDHPARPGVAPRSCPRGDRSGPLCIHVTVRTAAGAAGRALAARQGHALAGLLDALAEVEVGQDRDASR